VAAHEAGKEQPSGSLLSGGSGEQQSKHPARTVIPRSLLTQRQCSSPPCAASQHHWQYQGKSKENRCSGWMAKRFSDPLQAPHLLGSQVKEEKECLEKKMHQLKVPSFTAAVLHRATRLHEPHIFAIRAVRATE